MTFKRLYQITGGLVFLISLVVLALTVQPTVSFWDCGEFLAASYSLQVPHPPGTPFFLILGRIFSLLPIAGDLALRMNYISVLSSAFSVLFLYLIAVKVIENYRGKEPKSMLDAVGTYLSAAIGALSFSFSDTFWFNGVEAEVYALSTFLLAAIVYLMILWNEKADNKDNEKYILMIAYLIGLSTAVHLMSVLAIISVVMIIMFRKYVDDEDALLKSGYILLGHIALALVISFFLWTGQKSDAPPTMEEYQSFDNRFKMIIAVVSVLFMAIFWKKIFHRNSVYLPLTIGGIALFVTYPGVVKYIPKLMAEIGGDDIFIATFILLLILGALAYLVYYSVKEKKPTLHLAGLSAVFIILGFSTYALVIIRANMDPPMNENQPDDFHELVSYLNREQYGDFPTFKRRFASEPHQMVVYQNYKSDADFWWKYQMNHMMTRYWLWNYAGRESWIQDAGVNVWPFNSVANFFPGKILNISFAGEAKDSLFGIPLILGLIGIYFHFRKDWKMAAIFMVLFIFMGYLTAFYQNQQQPQPRERDYFYVGAFFVFSMWIGIAIRGIIDFAEEKLKNKSLVPAVTYTVLAFGVLFVPVRMVQANYFTHDRSRNYVPWDYSYNLLQSCAPNAILFTNGDNDTFPLWYLQDVAGVRRDIRIANLSLLNTPWYILQLKNLEPYGAQKVKMRLTDEMIERIQPIQWETQVVNLPVSQEVIKKFGVKDSTIIKTGKVTFTMANTAQYGDIKAVRVQDLMVKEIVESNLWDRPIYFAVTCTEDSKIGLQDYLRMEGMAFRVVPDKRQPGVEFINEEVMRQQVYTNTVNTSLTYKPGFNFRGMNDSTIFFDENHTRLSQNYRNAFIRLALYYQNVGRNNDCVQTLDLMETKLPRKILPLDYRLLFDIASLYNSAGATKQYNELAKEVEKTALQKIEENPRDVSSYYNPYRLLLEIYETQKEYKKALGILNRLQVLFPQDEGLKGQIERFKLLSNQSVTPDTTKK